MSTEIHEPALHANKTSTPVKTERDARPQECETTRALPSVKRETQSVEITAHGLGSSRHDDLTRTIQESEDDVFLELLKPNKFIQNELCPNGSGKELKDIKREEEVSLNLCGELDGVKKMKKEDKTSLGIFSQKSSYVNEIESGSTDLEKSHTGLQDEIKVQEMVGEPKKIKIEKIWPDEDDSQICSDNPLEYACHRWSEL